MKHACLFLLHVTGASALFAQQPPYTLPKALHYKIWTERYQDYYTTDPKMKLAISRYDSVMQTQEWMNGKWQGKNTVYGSTGVYQVTLFDATVEYTINKLISFKLISRDSSGKALEDIHFFLGYSPFSKRWEIFRLDYPESSFHSSSPGWINNVLAFSFRSEGVKNYPKLMPYEGKTTFKKSDDWHFSIFVEERIPNSKNYVLVNQIDLEKNP